MTQEKFLPRFHNEPVGKHEAETDELTLKGLEKKVISFRDTVEIAWSKNTAYANELSHNVEGGDTESSVDGLGRFNPKGQCAVTSRLLKDELSRMYPGIKICSQVGKLIGQNQQVLDDNHVWLEVDINGNTVVVDSTPDQIPELHNVGAKIIVQQKDKLAARGYVYHAEKEDTDENMQSGGSFQRYEILKRRFENTVDEGDFYDQLLKSNVYIVAPVAAGKTELMNSLSQTLPFNAIDMGTLFRMSALMVLADTDEHAAKPDLQKLTAGDKSEVDRIVGALSRRKKYLKEEMLDKTTMSKSADGKFTLLYQGENLQGDLQSSEVNALVATVAKSPVVRETVWRWIRKVASDNGGVILTGHSLTDIDTTKFRTIHLEVSDDVAAQRVMGREGASHGTIEDAKRSLQARNESDHIPQTRELIPKIRSADTIDTSNLTPVQVKFRTLRRLAERAKEAQERGRFQAEYGVERENFHWVVNPLLSNVRLAGADIIARQEAQDKNAGITEFDLAVQTTIHLAAYSPDEVWLGDKSVLNRIQELVSSGEIDAASELFEKAFASGDIRLNGELAAQVCARQAEKLKANAQHLYIERNGQKLQLPAEYMGSPDQSPFKDTGRSEINTKTKQMVLVPETGEMALVVTEKSSGKKITFKKVPHDISEMYGKGFHYLHEGRADEITAFGAYLEDDIFPFAWVSYSPTDRVYKQEMLEHVGLEPHTVLELTRAWNSSWSPKNTMSTLFGYAHQVLQRDWEKKVDAGDLDKPLSGIISAINGNLGFNGSAFSAANLKVVGLKPANFTYLLNEDGTKDYMPRRAIVKALGLKSTAELAGHPRYATNKFPLIPTNEMVVAFDRVKQDSISKKPLYRIQNEMYATGS